MLPEAIRQSLIGKPILQPLWERLHRLALYGMNVGYQSNVDNSGEIWAIDYFGKQLPSNIPAVVFDVGANVGHYASAVITRLGKRARLYCFEPSKKTFQLLATNLGDHENVELFNFGFGDKEESTTLFSNAVGSGLASVYNRRLDHFDISMTHKEEIYLRTLDNFCRDERIQYINLLKLDVEGHELKVLKGAQSLISSNAIDFIQFEFGGCDIDSRTYFQDFFYLLNPYYKIHRILKCGLAPIEAYKETYEVFITTCYLAISRS